jgi:HAD superfamily hydrolase (TIGR01509 family)
MNNTTGGLPPELRSPGDQAGSPALKAVLFDMDGVLVETEPCHMASYVIAFRKFGLHISPEEYTRTVTLGGTRVYDWFRSLGGDASREDLYAAKDSEFARLAGESLVAKDGAAGLVGELAAAGIGLAVGTSARRSVVTTVLRQVELLDFFSTIVAMEDVVRIKPDPEVYLKAASHLGVMPGEAVVIEDTPNGILAAKRAGISVVGVPSVLTMGADFSDADLVCRSLSDLNLVTLDALLRRRVAVAG